jgi:hypothetical protein
MVLSIVIGSNLVRRVQTVQGTLNLWGYAHAKVVTGVLLGAERCMSVRHYSSGRWLR